MRYIMLIVFILISSVAFAQEDWSWPSQVYSESWLDLCGGQGNTIGFDTPTITSNDSMLFYRYWCFITEGVAYSLYENGEWGWPNPVSTDIVGEYVVDPFFAEFDSTLYYCVWIDTGGHANYDIRATRLVGGLWTQAWSLGSSINTISDEVSPSMPSDGSRLYFMRADSIMYSDIISGQFTLPVSLPAVINSAQRQSNPVISPDGRRLYFNRGYNDYDPFPLYVSVFNNGAWQEAVSVGDSINSDRRIPGCEMMPPLSSHPTFSLNDTKMYFGYLAPIPPMCDAGAAIMVSQRSTAVMNESPMPNDFALSAHPNPFNSEIKITVSGKFDQPFDLVIYNLAGQKIRNLSSGTDIIWDGKDGRGHSMSSGLYFVKATGPNLSKTLKITLLR